MAAVNLSMSDQSDARIICWNCQEIVCQVANCSSCHTLLPHLKTMDPFELLGITASMNVDLDNLDAHYLRMIHQFHPDQFICKSQTEKDIAQSYTAQINNAYKALKCPVLRGKHLFSIVFGQNIDEIPDPAGVLVEVFELNEQCMSVASVAQAKDVGQKIATKMEAASRDYDAAITGHDQPTALHALKTFLYLFKVYGTINQTLTPQPLD